MIYTIKDLLEQIKIIANKKPKKKYPKYVTIDCIGTKNGGKW